MQQGECGRQLRRRQDDGEDAADLRKREAAIARPLDSADDRGARNRRGYRDQTWVQRRGDSSNGERSASAAADAAVLVGEWRIPGETHVLAFRIDRSYQWGPRISGTFTMLSGQRVRMTVVQDGKQVGQLDSGFVVDGAELRLTAPDGAVTKYERVGPASLCP